MIDTAPKELYTHNTDKNSRPFYNMKERIMYKEFNEAVRTIMQEANAQAQELGHEYVATEHILLAVSEDTSCIALFKEFDIKPETIVTQVMRWVEKGLDGATTGTLSRTPRTRKIIELALEEAESLKVTNNITPPFLVLGILREQEGVAAYVLMNLGLKLEDVRDAVSAHLKTADPQPVETTQEASQFRQAFTVVYYTTNEHGVSPEIEKKLEELQSLFDGIATIEMTEAPIKVPED